MKKYCTLIAAAFVLVLVPMSAHAELWIYCGGLPGCPSGFTERISSALLILLTRLPNYIYMLGVLFIMIGGVSMAISAGDSEKVTKGKNTITWAVLGILVMQLAQTVVNLVIIPEVDTRNGASDLVASLTITIINDILILLYVILLVVAVFSGMRMVVAFGQEEEFKKGRDGLLWAAIGAIVINLARALATAFCLTNTSVCFIA